MITPLKGQDTVYKLNDLIGVSARRIQKQLTNKSITSEVLLETPKPMNKDIES